MIGLWPTKNIYGSRDIIFPLRNRAVQTSAVAFLYSKPLAMAPCVGSWIYRVVSASRKIPRTHAYIRGSIPLASWQGEVLIFNRVVRNVAAAIVSRLDTHYDCTALPAIAN